MVSVVVIYCFCLFKQKKVVRADVSINTNMYGLNRSPAAGKENSQEEGNYPLIPSSTNVSAKSCVRVVVRVFPK
jgi:hypothetical protein